jgi:DNA-binding NarL/FixJ family response regulator
MGRTLDLNRPAAAAPTKILIVDDHAVLRMGLAALFGTVPNFAVVGEAATAAAALVEARRCRPDVVMMDVRLPDGSGVEACRAIREERPETRVIMFTSFADEDSVVEAVMADAAGYVLKGSEPQRLIEAIEAVAAGGSLLDPSVTDTVLRRMRRMGTRSADDDPLAALSKQERKVLPLLAAGRTNREIGASLFVSEHTAKSYVSDILRKLGVARRSQAAALASRLERRQDE